AGEDGLELVDIMLKEAPTYLNDGGWLFVEVGNSEVHMSERFPGLEVIWLEFENGGTGIFAIQKNTLVQYFSSKD
ncbi:MAG: 50S ribosomal protein L3 N(5)-glutamine methyltransferase, partial [Pseudomonadota bacterium]|nr:50S ribosomal protein L3 N(5)-glutamine methyltransferase [Pseudomonadota bacterium]